MIEFDKIDLVDNPTLQRFEWPINNAIAFVEYQLQGRKIYLVHTEVPEDLQGKGIGSALVKKVMEKIQEMDKRLVPYCPYILQFLKKHPEYEQLR